MKFYKMKDSSDNFTIINKNMFSLPFRLLVIGRTGAGKSGVLGNLLLRKDALRQYYKPINNKEKPEHTLFIFDDLGFTNKMNKSKKDSMLDRIFCNGRKFLVSTITLNQKMTQLSTCAREQASSVILFSSSNKQLDIIEADFNYLNSDKKQNRKQFFKLIKDHTSDLHEFIIIDISKKNIYFNKDFKEISLKDY